MEDVRGMYYRHFRDMVEEVIPDAFFGQDNDGQVIVYTGLTISDEQRVVPQDDE